MKKNRYSILLILILFAIGIMVVFLLPKGKGSINQMTVTSDDTIKSIQSFNVSQISRSEWNTPTGIPYVQVPGANLGATAFQILDQKRIAFLCNSSNEIIITDKVTGDAIDKFQISFAPRDFVYENSKYYVLTEYDVVVYDETGNEITKYPFPMDYQGVESLTRFNDATYLLLPEGNSLMIEDCGESIEPTKFEGIISGNGYFVSSRITGSNTFSIKISSENNQEKNYITDKKVAGAFIIGTSQNRVFLDVQTFISENPIAVERTITSVELNNNELGVIVAKTNVPNSYYVISNKDFYVSEKGNIYNMMTSPQGVFVFSLSETNSEKTQGYPSTLTDHKYNSNDNIIKID